jgi:alpha-ribazole phosphatase
MEFVLIRHTRCEGASGICYGQLDIPLALSAAADIANVLDRTPVVDLVVASPSQRCLQLATQVAARDRCGLRVQPELQELHFGDWEGKRWDDIPPSEIDAWAQDTWNCAAPGGETEQALWRRVTNALAQLMPLTHPRRIAIVSHGGPLRVLRCLLTQTDLSDRWTMGMDLGEVVRIKKNRPEI